MVGSSPSPAVVIFLRVGAAWGGFEATSSCLGKSPANWLTSSTVPTLNGTVGVPGRRGEEIQSICCAQNCTLYPTNTSDLPRSRITQEGSNSRTEVSIQEHSELERNNSGLSRVAVFTKNNSGMKQKQKKQRDDHPEEDPTFLAALQRMSTVNLGNVDKRGGGLVSPRRGGIGCVSATHTPHQKRAYLVCQPQIPSQALPPSPIFKQHLAYPPLAS